MTRRRFALVHILPIVLTGLVLFAPKARPGLRPCGALLAAIAVIELLFLLALARRRRAGQPLTAPCDIVTLVWALLTGWELTTSVLHLAHPVLVPAPENVFDTFREQPLVLLRGVASSLELLAAGFSIGLALAVLLGLFAGWIDRLRAFTYPIANVMAPIPAVVLSPYLVSLMPSFRSASALVIVLGVFWPAFLGTINRVTSIEPQILDSARMLQPDNRTMIFSILLPYILPGVISGLKVSMTTSLLMLNFAELMGATSGMGYYVQNSIVYANYAHAVAGILVIGVVVTVLNALITKFQRFAIRWH